MEQNNFEKQVRQKLDEFKIPPSEKAWFNIENKIEKKNHRRFFMVILFSLFLFTGVYWLFNAQKNIGLKQDQLQGSVIKMEKADVEKQEPDFKKLENTHKKEHGKIGFQNNIHTGATNTLVANTTSSKKQKISKEIRSFKNNHGKIALVKEPNAKDEIKNNKLVNNIQDSWFNQASLPGKVRGIAKPKGINLFAVVENPAIEKVPEDNLLAVIIKEKHLRITEIVMPVAHPKIPVSPPHQKRWIWGVSFSGGSSMITNGRLGNNFSSDPSNQTNGSSNSYLYSFPSSLKNSIGYTGGILLESNISDKSKIAFGINYKFYSAMNKVGKKIDTSIRAYTAIDSSVIAFTSGNSLNNHRNHFNYIELPVSIKLRLSHTNSTPIFWKVGISISQLISSNALQYKSNPSIYYSDNSLFSKTQFGFNTGIAVTLFSKEKYPISIGPSFYYGASRLANKGLYKDKHFSFIGISTEILFGKK